MHFGLGREQCNVDHVHADREGHMNYFVFSEGNKIPYIEVSKKEVASGLHFKI